MKNLPLQTTVRPAQAEGSVLQTALDLKEILILSRFKVQQSQVAVIPGKVHSKSSSYRAAAEANKQFVFTLLKFSNLKKRENT